MYLKLVINYDFSVFVIKSEYRIRPYKRRSNKHPCHFYKSSMNYRLLLLTVLLLS